MSRLTNDLARQELSCGSSPSELKSACTNQWADKRGQHLPPEKLLLGDDRYQVRTKEASFQHSVNTTKPHVADMEIQFGCFGSRNLIKRNVIMVCENLLICDICVV